MKTLRAGTILLLCLWSVPALYGQACTLADPSNCVYFSNFQKELIQAVTRDAAAPQTPIDIATLASGERAEDSTVGPDNRLYVALPANNRIIRFSLNGSNRETVYDKLLNPAGPSRPQGLRFDALGNLLFSTEDDPATPASEHTGIFRIAGAAAVPFGGAFAAPALLLSAAQTGTTSTQGLAFKNNGDVLIVDQANNRVLLNSTNCTPPATVCPLITTGLSDPTGIAVSSVGDIYVSNGGTLNSVRRFSQAGAFIETYASFGADRPNYLEFEANDKLYVGTAIADFTAGKVWRVDAAETKTLLVDLHKNPANSPAVSGVAMPASGTSKTKAFSAAEIAQIYNFGFSSIEFVNMVNGTCDLAVSTSQTDPRAMNEFLTAFGAANLGSGLCRDRNGDSVITGPPDECASVIPFKGEEGFLTVFSGDQPSCFNGPIGISISGFFDYLTPRIVKIHNGVPQVLPLGQLYASGGMLGDPDDPTVGTKDFSDFFLANVPLEKVGNFCGFLKPIVPEPQTFNCGQNVTIKFQVTEGAGCTGDFITPDDGAVAVIGVARVKDANGNTVFERVQVNPSGSSVFDPPVFEYDASRRANQYKYTLNTTGYLPGTYEVNVNSNVFSPQKINFILACSQ